MKHPRCYRALKAYGFSPCNALTILLDADRGNDGALLVIGLATKAYRAQTNKRN